MAQSHSLHDTHLTTPEERLQHDIEELESGSGWRGAVRWIVVLVIAGVAVGSVYYLSSGRKAAQGPRMTAAGTFIIETSEPQRAKLDAAPIRFKWESIAGKNDYMFEILQQGVPEPVVQRTVRENVAELTSEEAARLVKGTTYIWTVAARAKDGKVMGSGRSWFDL